jgi:hypothetical protein
MGDSVIHSGEIEVTYDTAGVSHYHLPRRTRGNYDDLADTYTVFRTSPYLGPDADTIQWFANNLIDMPGDFQGAEVAVLKGKVRNGAVVMEATPKPEEAPRYLTELEAAINRHSSTRFTAALDKIGTEYAVQVEDDVMCVSFLWVKRQGKLFACVNRSDGTPAGDEIVEDWPQEEIDWARNAAPVPPKVADRVIALMENYQWTSEMYDIAMCRLLDKNHGLKATRISIPADAFGRRVVPNVDYKTTYGVRTVYRGKTFLVTYEKGMWRVRVCLTARQDCILNLEDSINSVAPDDHVLFKDFNVDFERHVKCVADAVMRNRFETSWLVETSGFMFRSDNAATLEVAREENAWVSEMETMHGFTATMDCLINISKAIDTLGGQGDLMVVLTLKLYNGNYVRQLDMTVEDAVTNLNAMFGNSDEQ